MMGRENAAVPQLPHSPRTVEQATAPQNKVNPLILGNARAAALCGPLTAPAYPITALAAELRQLSHACGLRQHTARPRARRRAGRAIRAVTGPRRQGRESIAYRA